MKTFLLTERLAGACEVISALRFIEWTIIHLGFGGGVQHLFAKMDLHDGC